MRTKDFNEEEILKKAIAIFWRKGYNATSLYDLIEELGIGRSSIYHAFGDKHNLYVKALDRYQQEGNAKIQNLLNNTASAKEAIAALLDRIIDETLSETCPKGCFKINAEVEVAADDELIKKMICDDNKLIGDALTLAIEKGQQRGEINNSKDPKVLASFICNTIAGMRVSAKISNDRSFFQGIAETALSVLD